MTSLLYLDNTNNNLIQRLIFFFFFFFEELKYTNKFFFFFFLKNSIITIKGKFIVEIIFMETNNHKEELKKYLEV